MKVWIMWAVSACALAACDGKVVVDPETDAGNGGALCMPAEPAEACEQVTCATALSIGGVPCPGPAGGDAVPTFEALFACACPWKGACTGTFCDGFCHGGGGLINNGGVCISCMEMLCGAELTACRMN
jgi:hypothetical protein